MNKTQKGFAIVEGLLILIIVLLVGFIGYYVWHTQSQTDKTSNDSVKASQSNSSGQSSSSANYLTIKEDGVKFKLNDKIKDAYYTVKDNGYIYLSVHRFDNIKGAGDCRAEASATGGSGLVALVTGKVGEDNGTPAGGTWTQADLDASGFKKVGDTYYGFQQGNAYCYDSDNPPTPDFPQTVTDIIKAFQDQTSTFTSS
jgi:competence protein ComGC